MARVKTETKDAVMDSVKDLHEEITKDPITSMPLECLEDYKAYNLAARTANKKLRVCQK